MQIDSGVCFHQAPPKIIKRFFDTIAVSAIVREVPFFLDDNSVGDLRASESTDSGTTFTLPFGEKYDSTPNQKVAFHPAVPDDSLPGKNRPERTSEPLYDYQVFNFDVCITTHLQ
jgi:hypothetical protein